MSKLILSLKKGKKQPTNVRRNSDKFCDDGLYEAYEITSVATNAAARDIVEPEGVGPILDDKGATESDLYQNREFLHSRGDKDRGKDKQGLTDSGYLSVTRKKEKLKEQKKAQDNYYANVEPSRNTSYQFSVDKRGGLFILHQIEVSVLVLENNIKKQSNVFMKQYGSDDQPSANIPNAQLKSKIYELGPEKLKLRDPITVKFPVDFSSHDVHKPSISVCYCSGGEWEELPKHTESTEAYFILGQFCSLKVTRPGKYVVIQKHTAPDAPVYANVNSNNNNNETELWYARLNVTKIENDQLRASVRMHQGIQDIASSSDMKCFDAYNGTGNVTVKLHLNATDVIASGTSTKVLTEAQIYTFKEVTFVLKQKKPCLGEFRISLEQSRITYCIFTCCTNNEKIYLEFKGESFEEVKTSDPRYTPSPKKTSMPDDTQPYTYVTVQSEVKNDGQMYMNTDDCNETQQPQSNRQRKSKTDAGQQTDVVEQLQRLPVLYVPSATDAKYDKRKRVLSNLTKESQNYPFSRAFTNVMKTTLIDTIIQNEAKLLSYVEEETCSGGKMCLDYLLQELFMDFSLDWHMVVYKGLVQISSSSSQERKVAEVFLLDIQKEKIRANMDRLCNEMKARMVLERMYSDKLMKDFEKQMVSSGENEEHKAKTLLEEVVLKSDTEVYECFIKALKDCNCQHLVDLIYVGN